MADRQLAEWDWKSGVVEESVTVQVRMKHGQKSGFHLNNIKGGAPTFYIKHDDPPIDLEDGDLTRLAKRLDEELESFFHIEWKPKLVVACYMEGEDDLCPEKEKKRRMSRTKIVVIVDKWDEGVRSCNGQKLYRAEGDQIYPHTDKVHAFYHKKDIRSHYTTRFDPPTTIAVIDDTPENRAALDTIRKKLVELGEGLGGFLAQEKIESALAGNVTKLLKGTNTK